MLRNQAVIERLFASRQDVTQLLRHPVAVDGRLVSQLVGDGLFESEPDGCLAASADQMQQLGVNAPQRRDDHVGGHACRSTQLDVAGSGLFRDKLPNAGQRSHVVRVHHYLSSPKVYIRYNIYIMVAHTKLKAVMYSALPWQ